MPPRRRRRGRSRRVTVRVEGIEALRDLLAELPDEIKAALRRAVRASAEAVRDDVREHVRVDTGNLRDSVSITYGAEDLTARVGWRDREDLYAVFHEFGTSSIPANPALTAAAQEERARLVARVREEVRRVLR